MEVNYAEFNKRNTHKYFIRKQKHYSARVHTAHFGATPRGTFLFCGHLPGREKKVSQNKLIMGNVV